MTTQASGPSPANAELEAPLPRMRHLLPLLLMAVTVVALFWPTVEHLGDEFTCACHDGASHIWLWHHTQDAVAGFDNPWGTTDGMFFPAGVNLAFNQVMLPVALAAWPVSAVFGLATTANLFSLAAAFLSAVAVYFIALRVGADRLPAAFAGMAFALAPFRFFHASDHLDIVHTEFTLFGVLAFLRVLERPTRARGAVFGVVAGLTYLANGYFFLLLGTAVVVLWATADHTRRSAARRLLALGAVVALVISLPLVLAQFAALRDGEVQDVDPVPAAADWSVDLTGWVVPPPTTAIGFDMSAERTGFGEGLGYIGLVVIAMAVAGWRWGDRRRLRPWLCLALVGGVVAMGPALRIAGWSGHLFEVDGFEFAIPLPGLLISELPIIGGFRAVGRFSVLVQLGVAVVAAIGLTEIMRRYPARAMAAFALATLVLLVEFQPDGHAGIPSAIPAAYETLASHDDGRAVLELPIVWSTGTNSVGPVGFNEIATVVPYYATEHGHPIVSGIAGRYADDRFEQLRQIGVFRQLLTVAGQPGFDDPLVFTADDLEDLGIGYVAYHRNRPMEPVLEHLEALNLPVLADDGTVVIYEVPG